MTDERDNPAPAGTADVREDQPLSLEDAASRLSGALDDGPEPEAPAADVQPAQKDEEQPAVDPDDWDAPVTEEMEGTSDAPEGAEAKAEDQPSEQGRFVGMDAKVRLDDGRVVTVAELRSGHLMHADYTRKTQELAEQRRSHEARQSEYEQQSQALASQRELVALLAQQFIPPDPDPAMIQSDPLGYMQAKEARDRVFSQLQQLAQGQMQEQERQGQSFTQAAQEHMAREAESLMQAMPELRDPNKRAKWSAELSETMKVYGIGPEDIAGAKDHRLFRMATDAMRYQRIVKNREQSAKKAQGKPPAVIEPGRRQSSQANAARDRQQLRDRVRQTGSVDDAAKAFGSLNL